MKKIIQQLCANQAVAFHLLISLLLAATSSNGQVVSGIVNSAFSGGSNITGNITSTPITDSIRMGTQVWTKKNLNISTYRNGDVIPQVTDSVAWVGLTTGAWCYYNNDPTLGALYGKLYNWYAVNDPRGLAPVGWHIPSDEEWTTLSTFIGEEPMPIGCKQTDTTTPGTHSGASNSNGFAALMGGARDCDTKFFVNFSYEGLWWTSSVEINTPFIWSRSLIPEACNFMKTHSHPACGFSVRCVKDTMNMNAAPVISNASANPASLWPPNHQLKNVTVCYNITGAYPPFSSWLTVKSNEPLTGTGCGDIAPDWIIVDNHHLKLRAERAGRGNGRVYTIRINAKNASGNITTKTTTVTVPHHRGSSYAKGTQHGNEGYIDANGDYFDQWFECTVTPNPSSQYFNLLVQTASGEKIEATLFDIGGRMISKLNTVKDQPLRFGDDLQPGVYLMKVSQGEQQKIIKVVKQ